MFWVRLLTRLCESSALHGVHVSTREASSMNLLFNSPTCCLSHLHNRHKCRGQRTVFVPCPVILCFCSQTGCYFTCRSSVSLRRMLHEKTGFPIIQEVVYHVNPKMISQRFAPLGLSPVSRRWQLCYDCFLHHRPGLRIMWPSYCALLSYLKESDMASELLPPVGFRSSKCWDFAGPKIANEWHLGWNISPIHYHFLL